MISEQRFAMEPLPPLLFFLKKKKKKKRHWLFDPKLKYLKPSDAMIF